MLFGGIAKGLKRTPRSSNLERGVRPKGGGGGLNAVRDVGTLTGRSVNPRQPPPYASLTYYVTMLYSPS